MIDTLIGHERKRKRIYPAKKKIERKWYEITARLGIDEETWYERG